MAQERRLRCAKGEVRVSGGGGVGSGASVLHFSRLLRHAWATVGLFFSPVTTRGGASVLQALICILILINVL
jgi:hypothetical protein